MNKDCINIKVPNKPEYVMLVRLAVSGLAGKLDLNFDQLNEVKLAVSEACNRIIEDPRQNCINVCCDIQKKKLIFNINNYFASKINPEHQKQLELSEKFITAFMDKVEKNGENLIMEKNF